MKIFHVFHVIRWSNDRAFPGIVEDEYHLTKRSAMRACKAIAEDLLDDFKDREEPRWIRGRKPRLCIKRMKNGYVVMECWFDGKKKLYDTRNEIKFEELNLKLWDR